MQCQIIRNETFTRGSINHIINENNRDGTEKINHKNENIKRERSHLNISRGINGTGYQTWKNKLKEMKIPIPGQKTGNLGQLMITASPNFFKECGWSAEAANDWKSYKDCPAEILNYFSDSLKFCKEYLGEENIMSWHLHFDETSPNLHVNYIPVFEGMKRKNVWARDEDGKLIKNEKGEKVRARDESGKIIYEYIKQSPQVNASAFWEQRGGRKSYRQMQNEFFEQVGKKYKLDRGEIGSKARHRNHHEYNATIEAQAQKIEVQKNQIKENEKSITTLELKREQEKDFTNRKVNEYRDTLIRAKKDSQERIRNYDEKVAEKIKEYNELATEYNNVADTYNGLIKYLDNESPGLGKLLKEQQIQELFDLVLKNKNNKTVIDNAIKSLKQDKQKEYEHIEEEVLGRY